MNGEGWIKPYYMKQNRWRFAGIIALAALTLLAAAALTFTSGFLISKASLRPENILMLYVPIVGVRTFGIARSVLRYVERLVSHNAVLRVLSEMRIRLYNQLEPHALQLRGRYRTGDLLGVMADDLESLQNVYVRTIFPGIAALIVYGVVVAALGWFDWSFALLIALYILVLVAIVPFASLYITRTWQQQLKHKQGILYSRLTDGVMGLGDLLISGRHQEFVNDYAVQEQDAIKVERKLSSHKRWVGLVLQVVTGLLVAQMAVWATAQVADRSMDATLLAACILVVLPLAEAFIPMTDAVNRIPAYQESVHRLTEFNDLTQLAELNELHKKETSDQSANYISAIPSLEQPAAITIDHASYTYPGDNEPVLRNIDLRIAQGEKIAIIGRSGAGKSTLLKLIQGVYEPDQGTVDLSGQAATTLYEQMHQHVSVLNQKPYLFDTTLLNNVRLSRPEATAEEVERALHEAQLSALIESLPLGYDTPMQEAGKRFSGGERQRIALARVLLQNTPIVILDEPTVGLDPRTEHQLLDIMLQSLSSKTMIWVTHHLVRAEQMDRILFMDAGEIVMQGTHQQLYAASARYRRLYELDHPKVDLLQMDKTYTVQAQ